MTQFEKQIALFHLHRNRFHQLANIKLVNPSEAQQRNLDQNRADTYRAMNQVAQHLEANFTEELAAYKTSKPGWPYSDLPEPKEPAPQKAQVHISPMRVWAGVQKY
jgi:hypothetical protein